MQTPKIDWAHLYAALRCAYKHDLGVYTEDTETEDSSKYRFQLEDHLKKIGVIPPEPPTTEG